MMDFVLIDDFGFPGTRTHNVKTVVTEAKADNPTQAVEKALGEGHGLTLTVEPTNSERVHHVHGFTDAQRTNPVLVLTVVCVGILL